MLNSILTRRVSLLAKHQPQNEAFFWMNVKADRVSRGSFVINWSFCFFPPIFTRDAFLFQWLISRSPWLMHLPHSTSKSTVVICLPWSRSPASLSLCHRSAASLMARHKPESQRGDISQKMPIHQPPCTFRNILRLLPSIHPCIHSSIPPFAHTSLPRFSPNLSN